MSCKFCGNEKVHAKGFCSPCYWRNKRNGSPQRLIPKPQRYVKDAVCSHCGIGKIRAKGLCSKCYYRNRINGSPDRKIAEKGSGGLWWKNSSGYKCVILNSKTILEHRFIMEKKLGRKLLRSEVVHHKNGIRNDNSEENLEVMTLSEHSIIENSKRSNIDRRFWGINQRRGFLL